MRKVLLILLVLSLLLCGCTNPDYGFKKPLKFYYPLINPDYGMGSSYIQPEIREGATISGGLKDILNLYLKGPKDLTTYSYPFQYNTQVHAISRDTTTLDITLTRGFATYTGLPLTIACACITMTCLELTDVKTVRIRAFDTTLDGAQYIEMNAETLLLIDLGKEIQE